ncbi:MAG: signal peptidase I [Coriobacteriales bacterium]|jgi:signal peptidase I|nr:signal peptidase I [Coriobacteriales bacterium]
MRTTEPERDTALDEHEEKDSYLWVLELFLLIAVVFFLTWLVRTYAIQNYEVPSGSMEPTIMTKDRLLADSITYRFREIEYNDIVTFHDKTQEGRVLIKRVIAVGGQTVDLRDGKVVVDGKILDEPYTHGKDSDPLPTQFDGVTLTYPYTVPDDMIWVMGDNRTNSSDSRFFGPIPVSSVTGHAFVVYWPLEDFSLL